MSLFTKKIPGPVPEGHTRHQFFFAVEGVTWDKWSVDEQAQSVTITLGAVQENLEIVRNDKAYITFRSWWDVKDI